MGKPVNALYVGDALDELRKLPSDSVDMCLTSPPYFRLRDYGANGQLGLEASVDSWAEAIRVIAAEIRRVLVPTGTFWLNLGDTYANHPRQGGAVEKSAAGAGAGRPTPAAGPLDSAEQDHLGQAQPDAEQRWGPADRHS
ncbi:DNA methyltransferase [Paenarthrobacter sp. NPDC056912]|uniref:DNA methyltransferase n=1 Tax=Paenarthrobacter sp. NPDC056912 TaxID=3345965 RepID=UPI0036721BDD